MIAHLLAPLRNRIANMIARAVVKIVDDAGGLQVLQLGVLDGETRDAIERFQEYGFTSRPLAGAEAAVLFLGGRRDHGIAVAVDDRRHRLAGLAEGDAALYRHSGEKVQCKSGEVVAKAATVRLGSDSADKALALAESVSARLDSIQQKFDAHTHAVSGALAAVVIPIQAIGPLAGVGSTTVKASS